MCSSCGKEEEHLVSLEARNTEQIKCSECGELMVRGVDAPVIGKSAYQMKAVMSDGSHVSGHFGKAAKKK